MCGVFVSVLRALFGCFLLSSAWSSQHVLYSTFYKYCSITQNSRFWWFHLKAVCMLNLVELNYVRYQDGKLSITCGTAKYVLE